MADKDLRRQLEISDHFDEKLEFQEEKKAKLEWTWLNHHNKLREFLLVSMTETEDDLDDDIPWT